MAELSAEEYCQGKVRHFESKADHSKREALTIYQLLILCTLAAPLFITLGQGVVFGKAVPAILSTLAAGCAIWLQQRKPQQLWALYRTTQRQLENEYTGYTFSIQDYATAGSREKLLAQRVATISMHANEAWVPLIPNPDKLISSLQPAEEQRAQSETHST
jgi:SMODS and SLOG-associating 2TM effector domain 1